MRAGFVGGWTIRREYSDRTARRRRQLLVAFPTPQRHKLRRLLVALWADLTYTGTRLG